MSERESMEFDVVIVGAGPAGLASACRLMQLAGENDRELSVCVVEKGSEVGAHILSGAIVEPRALDELFPDWQERGAPLHTAVSEDQFHLLRNAENSVRLSNALVPKIMHNQGNYIASLGNLCRWLGEQAEALGVEVFPGFAASELLYDDAGNVAGITTGDMGIGADGQKKENYVAGMELYAKYTLFSEGARGHLGKQLLKQFSLDRDSDVQHYGIGIKELWEIPEGKHQPGLVVHGAGWPLDKNASGGFFLYHLENRQVAAGLIVDLNYRNPHLSPYDEFQRLKHHPLFRQYLEGGTRISCGARAIAKGGYNSLPKMTFPGGILLGCDAGTLNFAKIKGTHTAMKSGMLAAEEVFQAISTQDKTGLDLHGYGDRLKQSWLHKELYQSRNFGPALHKLGTLTGGAFNFIEQNIFAGKLPFTLRDTQADFSRMGLASEFQVIDYPKPDGKLSFDKLTSVFLSNTYHEEDQPCHLRLEKADLPIEYNLPRYGEPAQRYCPAGVYEILSEDGRQWLQINAQNCIHCKTCDIKDPAQNITWCPPEGGGGPSYPNM